MQFIPFFSFLCIFLLIVYVDTLLISFPFLLSIIIFILHLDYHCHMPISSIMFVYFPYSVFSFFFLFYYSLFFITIFIVMCQFNRPFYRSIFPFLSFIIPILSLPSLSYANLIYHFICLCTLIHFFIFINFFFIYKDCLSFIRFVIFRNDCLSFMRM